MHTSFSHDSNQHTEVNIMHTPDPLLISIKKLMLEVTDNLDPFIGLKLTGLARQITNVAYMMGHYDGQRYPLPAPYLNVPALPNT
jgi:hypothetical protein